ncbi:response regulator [Candidatus Collierbacteria bacterium]|nr:response regulator [Candidatus Collierbacteria bacterium]
MDQSKPKRILIVDDEKPLVRALELKFTNAGFKVMIAMDGDEALEILGKETFDIVLLDLVMPKKDGFEVLTELKAKGKKVPVIVLSNLSQDEDIKRAKELGAIDYLVKPETSIFELVSKVK